MAINFLAQIAIGAVMQIAGYLMYPKPKRPKPEAAREMDKQTAESGKPIPVIFGSMTISSANLLDAADKEIITRETTVSKK